MKLPIHLPLKKKELPSFYLALLLREEKATAVIFEEVEGKVQVIGKHEEEFSESIEAASVEEFLDVLDKTISTAESTLPQDVETQKTVFGLKETWVEDAKIKKEYLSKLKKASDALGLSPIGFLVIHEAIAHLLQKEEGAPVSAILIEVGKRYEVVSLLRAGRIVETHRAKIEDSITQTSDRLLHHFSNPQVLPARIILLDGDTKEDLQQDFISHTWSKSLPFLHVPQITVLPQSFDAKAMLFGAATQMGFDVLGQELETIAKGPTDIEPRNQKGKKTKEKEEEEEEPEENSQEEEEEQEEEPEEDENFGFVVGKDIRGKKSEVANDNIEPLAPLIPAKKVEEHHDTRQAASISVLLGSSEKMLSRMSELAKKIKLPKNLPAFPKMPKGPKHLLLIPIIFALLVAGLLFYIFGLSADVTLLANAQKLEKKQDVTLSDNSATDLSTSTIAVSFLSTDENGSVSENATGKKQVGDKAKGNITLYNNTSDSVTFSKGTTLVSDKGLKFDLGQDATVASASGDAFSGTKPGTTQVAVTADDIGTEYNLPSGVKFTVSGASSSIAAKNDNAFSGGTKKDITVVSKDDIGKATDELKKNLESKAKDDIVKKIPTDSSIVGQFVDETVSSQKASKQAGDEASQVTLTATITYKAATYKTKDAQNFAQELLKNDNQNGSLESTSFSFEDVQSKENALSATFVATSALLPKIDEKNLAEQIAGKSFIQTRAILTKLPQIEEINVRLHPNIFFFPKSLPKLSSHIHLKVVKQ